MSSPQMTAAIFAEALVGAAEVHVGNPDALIMDGSADSRRVKPGDLFVAFRGDSDDGNRYLEDAFAAGATAVIGERPPLAVPPERAWAVVVDSRVAVARLARDWRALCAPKVVGITGTVGKTTAKEMTASVLEQHFRTHRSKENFNSREGLPLALASLRRDHEVSVLEMAMDSKGEIAELCSIARPDVGVVLNIGLTHVARLGSVEAIANEKLALPRSLGRDGVAVLNADDARVAAVVPELNCRTLTFGASAEADLRRGPIRDLGLDGCVCDLTYDGETALLRTALPGSHVVPAALCAVAVALALGLPFADAVASVGRSRIVGRMHVVRTTNGVTVLDDRYNSSPASLEGALGLLGGLAGRRVAVVGTMAELGEHEESEHRRLGTVAARTCDVLLATGEACQSLVDSARNAGLTNAQCYESKEALAAALPGLVQPGDTVLIKASRSLAFETLLPVLEAAG